MKNEYTVDGKTHRNNCRNWRQKMITEKGYRSYSIFAPSEIVEKVQAYYRSIYPVK